MLPPVADPPRRILFGVALVCFASLLLEVVLTRIFSAMMYYHFTFLAISLALLGLGASGVYVYVHAERFAAQGLEPELARHARRFAAAALLTLAYLVANPVAETTRAGDVRLTNFVVLRLILLIAVTVLPFFHAGVVVSLAVTAYRRSINTVYAWDLLGASCAVVLAGLVLKLLGGPSAVVVVAVAAAAAAALFSGGSPTRWLPAAACLLVLAASARTSLFALPPLKSEAGELLFEAWNAFSRVTVMELRPEVLEIQIDAAAATRIRTPASGAEWRREISALGFALSEGGPSHVLVIGPGGGMDVANALGAGTRGVTAVDINPIITDTVMRGRFLAESGGLYQDPRVKVVVGEGRSFIRRSRERYDIIQATLIDTWAATSAGAFALTENNLYTVEAFEDYYAHLTDGGALVMCRYYTGQDPETVRLVVLAAAALERRGVPAGRTRDYIYLAAHKNRAVLIAKRTPFTAPELDRLDAAAAGSEFETALSPRTSGRSQLERLVDGGAWNEAVRAHSFDITPPTDDRPFFFYFARSRDLLDAAKHLSRPRLMNPGLWVMGAIALTLTTLAVVFVFVPLAIYRLSELRGGGAPAHLRRALGLSYFALIGLAFMTVEIVLIQKLVLFLGHPTYAFITVLSAVLVGSAGGALLGGRWAAMDEGRLSLMAGGAVALAVVAAAFASGALRAAMVWPLSLRVAATFVGTGALGILMGMMLPTGVRLVSRCDAGMVPWAWGVNGGMSVIATVGATVSAIHVGFTATFIAGAALYVLAGGCGLWLAMLARQAGQTAPTRAQASVVPAVADS
jgi:hypothetical protein